MCYLGKTMEEMSTWMGEYSLVNCQPLIGQPEYRGLDLIVSAIESLKSHDDVQRACTFKCIQWLLRHYDGCFTDDQRHCFTIWLHDT